MSKPKILYLDKFYEMSKDFFGDYTIFGKQENTQLQSLIPNKNINIFFKFNDKKDRRQEQTKQWHVANFATKHIFPSDQYPKGDFTFIQQPYSSTKFNIKINHNINLDNQTPTNNNVFNWNGCFKDITIYSSPYQILNINHNNTKYPPLPDDKYRYRKLHELKINSENIKEISISGNKEDFTITNAISNSLEKLIIKNNSTTKISIAQLGFPNLKILDLSKSGTISLDTEYYSFSSLDFDFSTDHYNGSPKSSEFKEQWNHFCKKINPYCKIKLSADQIIEWDKLPSTSAKNYRWKVKDLFDCKGKSTIEVYPFNFIEIYYKNQEKRINQEMSTLSSYLKNIQTKHTMNVNKVPTKEK